ncbi:MAG: thioredoxin family protein, partial [Akkermansia sp.]
LSFSVAPTGMRAAFFFVLLSGLATAALPRYPDAASALAAAASTQGSVLLDFTGSDWCPACIHLDTRILSTDALEEATGGRYGIVTLDFPRKPEAVNAIPADERERRSKLLRDYRIEGLPTVVVLDAQGRPYGVLLGAAGSPAEYAARLAKAEEARAARDAAFAAAEQQSGEERARSLAAGLNALPEVCRDKYPEVLDALIAADPQDSTGYAGIRRRAQLYTEQMQAFRTLSESFAGKLSAEELEDSLQRCRAFLQTPDLHPEAAQACYACMADAYALRRDLPHSIDCTARAIEAAPQTRMVPRLRANLENMQKLLRDKPLP